jgi:transposase-like protein
MFLPILKPQSMTIKPEALSCAARCERFDRRPNSVDPARELRAPWLRPIGRLLFYAFPPEVRKAVYTTNAIESVNAQLPQIIKAWLHKAKGVNHE